MSAVRHRMGIFPIAFLFACSPEFKDSATHPYPVQDSNPDVSNSGPCSPDESGVIPDHQLRIATFNIQVFGETKASREEIMDVLADMVRRYDVIAIQEIKNAAGEVPGWFLDEINSDGSQYEMVVSPRSGEQEDDASSQEQYAFYYDTLTVESLDEGMLYDDWDNDQFQREPWVASFSVKEGDFSFVLQTIHTKPSLAVEEIEALHDVFAWSQAQYPDQSHFVMLGDFNAGCDYAYPEELDELEIRQTPYEWIVPDSADTNVAGSACAYDRIVSLEPTINSHYTDDWSVDEFEHPGGEWDLDDVSDHWPVSAGFYACDQLVH